LLFCAVPLLEEREIKVGGLNPVVETLFFYSQLPLFQNREIGIEIFILISLITSPY